MGAIQSYRMRLRRKKLRLRALRKRHQLSSVIDRTAAIAEDAVLAFVCLRNERVRLPYFLDYYRSQGVDHFLTVDNGSTDGSGEFLRAQPDVSVWHTGASYKSARFGADWLNALLGRYGTGHWCLTVDVDEFLVYPFCDTRPLAALTDWLDDNDLTSFGTMLLDMYPQGEIGAEPYVEGQNPFEIAEWFDGANYTITRNDDYHNLWIQGGPRARAFFPDKPEEAPSLNKVPLIKWQRGHAYVHSTHMALPRRLNRVYDTLGGEKATGILLHAKFLDTLPLKAAEEMQRREHFAGGREYRAYHMRLGERPDLWTKWSERYINWRQLEILGLMSKGNWA